MSEVQVITDRGPVMVECVERGSQWAITRCDIGHGFRITHIHTGRAIPIPPATAAFLQPLFAKLEMLPRFDDLGRSYETVKPRIEAVVSAHLEAVR